MRAVTSGVNVVGGLLGVRVCLLLVLVFFCAIDRSSTIDATTRRTTDTTLSFRRPGALTREQLNSAVTIEFNFNGIDRKNRTAVEIAYREVRKKIVELLNRRKSTAASPTFSTTTVPKTTTVATTDAATTIDPTTTTISTTPSTTIATTTITTIPTTTASVTTITTSSTTTATSTPTTTTSTPTTTPTTAVTTPPTTSMMATAAPTTTARASEVETTTVVVVQPTCSGNCVGPNRKRRRRNSGGNNDTLTEEDLLFVDNDHEFDENEQLRISFFIEKEGLGDLDLGELLHEAAKALDKSNEREASPRIRVNVYKGLPKELTPAETSQLGFNFWFPVLLASTALLLIFIFIIVRFWSSRNRKTGDALDREKLIPVLMG